MITQTVHVSYLFASSNKILNVIKKIEFYVAFLYHINNHKLERFKSIPNMETITKSIIDIKIIFNESKHVIHMYSILMIQVN